MLNQEKLQLKGLWEFLKDLLNMLQLIFSKKRMIKEVKYMFKVL